MTTALLGVLVWGSSASAALVVFGVDHRAFDQPTVRTVSTPHDGDPQLLWRVVEGANQGCDSTVCALAIIEGYTLARKPTADHALRRSLADGSLALFVPADCSGAHCSDSELWFTRKGQRICISARGASFETLAGYERHLQLVASPT